MDQALKEPGHVLVAEDEFMVALDLSSMIEDAEYAVLGPAPSVEKALSLLSQSKPVAAFLDENLNGASVAPVVHELVHRCIPFVIISGYGKSISDDPLLRKARRIQKPASPHQIRDALAGFVSANGC